MDPDGSEVLDKHCDQEVLPLLERQEKNGVAPFGHVEQFNL